MKKIILFALVLFAFLSCKESEFEAVDELDQCKPKDPVTYFEVRDITAYARGIHQDSGKMRVGLRDSVDVNEKLQLFYPELIHELSVFTFCPCNLPLQFQKEGVKFKISGFSRIERSYLKFYQDMVANPTNQPHDGDGCLPFEITKIEAIE